MTAAPATPRTRRVALTGGIGTGKSAVLSAFAAHGVPTIDADALAHQAVAPGTPGLAAVVARFGPGVLDGAGALNRAALAAVVFTDAAARRDLEAIIHPTVREAIDRWFDALDGRAHRFAVADIPLLYETGRERDFDAVVVAACARPAQIARVMARDRISADDVERRIAAQLPLDDKVTRADYVIDTNGSPDQTRARVDALSARLAAG